MHEFWIERIIFSERIYIFCKKCSIVFDVTDQKARLKLAIEYFRSTPCDKNLEALLSHKPKQTSFPSSPDHLYNANFVEMNGCSEILYSHVTDYECENCEAEMWAYDYYDANGKVHKFRVWDLCEDVKCGTLVMRKVLSR